MLSSRCLNQNDISRGPVKAVYDISSKLNNSEINVTTQSTKLQKAQSQLLAYSDSRYAQNPSYWRDIDDSVSPSSENTYQSSPDFLKQQTRATITFVKQNKHEDIRRHFPIVTQSPRKFRTQSRHIPRMKLRKSWHESSINLSSVHSDTRKRVVESNVDEESFECACCTPPKQTCSSINVNQSRSQTPADYTSYTTGLLKMGANTKFNKRYYELSRLATNINNETSTLTVGTKLAPICPVPMPTFLNTKSNDFVTNDWTELNTSNLNTALRTVETQTSPLYHEHPLKNRHSRRNSGAKMISSLRKTMGNIRRAVSADRCENRSSSPNFKLNKTISLKRNSITEPDFSLHNNQTPTLRATHPIVIEYSLIKIYSDKTVRIQLKRKCTSIPFGFYIAKDRNGMYVSRFNPTHDSVYTRRYINIGDRILELQGIPCKTLSIENVHGLLHNCHIAQFRIKCSKTSTVHQNQSSSVL